MKHFTRYFQVCMMAQLYPSQHSHADYAHPTHALFQTALHGAVIATAVGAATLLELLVLVISICLVYLYRGIYS